MAYIIFFGDENALHHRCSAIFLRSSIVLETSLIISLSCNAGSPLSELLKVLGTIDFLEKTKSCPSMNSWCWQ